MSITDCQISNITRPTPKKPNYLFIKEKVSLREYKIYKYLNDMNLHFIPKLYRYNKKTQSLTTQKIIGLCVADFYGESFKSVPKQIISQIRDIIQELYNNGIMYPDITGYNFIVDKHSKVWIIDFEHCFYINPYQNLEDNILCDDIIDKNEHIHFIQKFLFNDENNWNTYFK